MATNTLTNWAVEIRPSAESTFIPSAPPEYTLPPSAPASVPSPPSSPPPFPSPSPSPASSPASSPPTSSPPSPPLPESRHSTTMTQPTEPTTVHPDAEVTAPARPPAAHLAPPSSDPPPPLTSPSAASLTPSRPTTPSSLPTAEPAKRQRTLPHKLLYYGVLFPPLWFYGALHIFPVFSQTKKAAEARAARERDLKRWSELTPVSSPPEYEGEWRSQPPEYAASEGRGGWMWDMERSSAVHDWRASERHYARLCGVAFTMAAVVVGLSVALGRQLHSASTTGGFGGLGGTTS